MQGDKANGNEDTGEEGKMDNGIYEARIGEWGKGTKVSNG
jgi:hypothetical protein